MYLGVGSSPINCTKEELLQIATALFIFRKMLRLILVLHHGKQPVSYAVHSGIVDAEIHPFRKVAEVEDISRWFEEEWFKEKNVIYVPA